MPDTIADLLIPEKEITANKHQLKNPGNQRSQCSAGNLHPGCPQMTKNKHPVKENVDKESQNGAEQRQLYLADTAQNDSTSQRQAHTEISGQQPAEIEHTVIHRYLFGSIDQHDHLGADQSGQGKHRGKGQTDAKHDGDGFAQPFLVLHPPEAGGEHRSSHTDAHAKDLKQVDKLPGQGRGRKLGIPHAAEHDGVHQIDPHGNQLLQGDRHGNAHHIFIKLLVPQISPEIPFSLTHGAPPSRDALCFALSLSQSTSPFVFSSNSIIKTL